MIAQQSSYLGQRNPRSSVLVRVGNGRLGRGVYATDHIAKGRAILTFAGPLIDFPTAIAKGSDEAYCLQVGLASYLDLRGIGRFVNHSCDPNAGISHNRTLIALTDIAKDAEICFDYSTTMAEDYWTMRCACGERECRGVITDFCLLPADVQLRYLEANVVQDFIRLAMVPPA